MSKLENTSFVNESIRKNILDHLFWDSRIDMSEITIDFVDGVAHLSGYVKQPSAKIAAEQDAWAVHGVKSVINDLAIKTSSAQLLLGDAEIKDMALKLIRWDLSIDYANIDVKVRNREITLEGSVPVYWQKLHVEECLYAIGSIARIHNHLTVVPTQRFSDESLSRAILNALSRANYIDKTVFDSIEIKVTDGNVELHGTVPNKMLVNSIEKMASQIHGVVSVKNELRVM